MNFEKMLEHDFMQLTTEQKASVACYMLGVLESQFDRLEQDSIQKEHLFNMFKKAVESAKK